MITTLIVLQLLFSCIGPLYTPSDIRTTYDVAIVGGGVAGTYSAWRLSEEMPETQIKIALFECENRIGAAALFFQFSWNKDPIGAAFHQWNPGVQSWKIIPQIRHPFLDRDLFICGEAYSSQQGWVEGALQSAESLLEQHFFLPRPDWVPEDYDVGP